MGFLGPVKGWVPRRLVRIFQHGGDRRSWEGTSFPCSRKDSDSEDFQLNRHSK